MMLTDKKPILVLLAGMVSGLMLAMYSLMAGSPSDLPDGTVARVVKRHISQADYARALSAVVTDTGRPLSLAERRRVLDRLIDEELLIQYGLDQGLVRSDRRVRAHLVSAVIEAKSIQAETREVSDDEAREFYAANADYFTRPQQLKLRILRLVDASQAQTVASAWSGGATLEELASTYQFDLLAHLPHALIPLEKLAQLVGASLAQTASGLAVGQVSMPVMVNKHAHLLRVDQRLDAPVAYENVAEQVKAELRRREAEQALRQELDLLRRELDVRIAEERL